MSGADAARLELRALTVRHPGSVRPSPGALNLRVEPGSITALVGPSGSGKSSVIWATLGLLPPGSTVSGEVWLDGARLDARGQRAARGRRIGVVLQDPNLAFDPRRRLLDALVDLTWRHLGWDAAQTRSAAAQRFGELGLDPALLDRRPAEVSGGQLQRAAIAGAMLTRPGLLLADEPTSALDTISRRHVLDLLVRAAREQQLGVLLVTHDHAAAAFVADRVVRLGGDGATIPASSAVAPSLRPTDRAPGGPQASGSPGGAPVRLAVRDLGYVAPSRGPTPARLLGGVDLDVPAGGALAVVGASGSGKSTLVRAIARMVRPSEGVITVDGEDLAALDAARPDRALRRAVQLLWQAHGDALDPLQTTQQVLDSVLDAGPEREAIRDALLRDAGLGPELAHARTVELSGGQQQRLALVRALATSPKVLLCDEPTSALDPETASQILALMRDLCRSRGMALLVVTHDLDVARAVSDAVIVLDRGAIVWHGPVEALDGAPEPVASFVAAAALPARRANNGSGPGDGGAS